MLLSAVWAAESTAIVLDPGLLSADADLADVQLGALRDEIEALRADLAVARARPAATRGTTPDIAPDDAPAAAASALGLPRAAGAPPAPGAGGGSDHATDVAAEAVLGAEPGPPELPWGFPAGYEEPATYRLTQGEALLHVAERFGTTVEEIAAANGIRDVDNVPVGMLLVLP